MNNRKWTREEDDRIIEVINDESLNLSAAFRLLARELNRSFSAVSYRWYAVLNNPEHKYYRGTTCFITICRKQALINKKIALQEKPKKVKKSVWLSVLKWLRIRK